MTELIKVPPHNAEAEMAVLGSIMIAADIIERVADMLRPEDFYRKDHGIIYGAMLDLFNKNSPVDIVSVSGRLKEQNLLKDVGDASYLTSLVNSVATASHIHHYADIVKKKKVLRDLIEASHQINNLGYQEEGDVEALLDDAEKKIFKISQSSLKQRFIKVKDALTEAWERIDFLHRGKGAIRGVPTGFPELDNILSGLQPSDLIVLAARPSLGKTALALDIARNVAVHNNITVGIFSLEMSVQQLIDRFIAAESNVDLWNLRTGRLREDSDDFTRIRDALEKLSKAPIFIDDAASNTILEIRAMSRRLKAEHGLGLIVVDYLQLMEGRKRTENRVQEVSEFSRSLKSLAKELDVPVLAISQLSRLVEQRHPPIPRLSDLRESGSIEQDADVVIFIYREDKAKREGARENIAEILIEKHRNGPTGRVYLYFNEKKVKFSPVEKYMGDIAEPPDVDQAVEEPVTM
ncbi:MAG: replicative DNA helicase [Candidatus Ryanbacteria bacterium RIFCSPHIGHO2_02_FULL_45_43]|uniref:Replicative DNA helicase n=1 Tax=Candidatus Ryanbacteria bacterium RIFCSPHIGHO2_01_45_13 TaxID=1802112 RepID=A0A1G2FYX8_9BACT|nr:MAG: replicative DNA helicase [Candidatus Ryanbacteria bacterium RIFCSPHIGHO2_01_FULL_44_130]OGZ42942.1 MAG: replicative DNA helicase [Candidatus Ryanbacteria bacterium RIFCSPHIGHO2_01_45_13]OGZ48647.1 MAG: replicative DNA helicase [Candidatus Ryanbacteria bacterium RIFCSPHIGHO2_02_FULL_45_43]OGZ50587.1 MAG: replicative DNA helicase [Candidatus Ryanbacteria bacterium RIFCSPHIGHO2_12_FULL_44_20]OGZ51893.1 MAG: replicative DNA helicase [Candidatus Ryanbacteria bacterium RIFCSPLOWO2_01_FULL_44_